MMKRARIIRSSPRVAARWLLVAGLLFSLSTSQAAHALTACMCETQSQVEDCECGDGCDPSSGMHGETSTELSPGGSDTESSVKGIEWPYSNSVTCCRPQQHSERPLITLNNQIPVDAVSHQAVVVPVVSGTVDVTRTHDPPRSRTLYVTHSCLRI